MKFLESVGSPEDNIVGIKRHVYNFGGITAYLAYCSTCVALDVSISSLHRYILPVYLSFLPASLISNWVIGPKIRGHMINEQKEKLSLNPDFKFDEDAIKYLVEKCVR